MSAAHTPVDDTTTVVTTAAATVTPAAVWAVLVGRTEEWWGAAYLGPGNAPMRLDPRLGGQVWSGDVDGAGDPTGALHGTIRAFDPPERLEIGGILVPGSYAGAITITIEATAIGSEIRVEQLARGRIDTAVEERISIGWAEMLARLTELADADDTD